MSDLIKREDAIQAIKDNNFGYDGDYTEVNGNAAIDDIMALPSAERKGEWILENGKIASFWVCSECDFPATVADEINDIKYFNYCPNCGARMKGEHNGQ